MASAPSESDLLLGGRRTPPPRYSTINPILTENQDKKTGESSLPEVHVRGQVSRPPGHPTGQQTSYQQGYETQPQFPRPGNSDAQPGWWSWVPGPAQYFPPGLEHMSHVSELTVYKNGRKFRVCRDEGQQIYVVKVDHPRLCSGEPRAVVIRVQNNAHLDVLHLSRTDEESACCSYSTTHLEICFPPGNMVGVVQGTVMEYTVHNPSGDLLFLLEKEADGCCSTGGYEIISPERFPLGKIYLEKSSCCSSAKEMKLSFPPNLDLRSKGLLLAGALSIRDLHWD